MTLPTLISGRPWTRAHEAPHRPGAQTVPARLPADTHSRVSFAAPCPACGHDCRWVEERNDTKTLPTSYCECQEK